MSNLRCVNHAPVQHRDSKVPWCPHCRLDKDFLEPESIFAFVASRKDRVAKLRQFIVEGMVGDVSYSEAEAHSMLNTLIDLCGGMP